MSRAGLQLRRSGQALALLVLLAAMIACSGTTTGSAPTAPAEVFQSPTSSLPAPLQTWAAANAPTDAPPGSATPPGNAAPPASETPLPDKSPGNQAPPAAPQNTPPALARPRQLTTGGCCSGHFWSADGRLLILDKPDPASPSGLWEINLQSGTTPQFVEGRLGSFSPKLDLRAFPLGRQTVVERLADEQQWVIPSGGRPVSFSPDGQQLAWNAGDANAPPGPDARRIWISQFDGSLARPVETIPGLSFSAWFPDGRLLVSGRLDPPESGQGLWAITPLPAGQAGLAPAVELARGERLRQPLLSPDGRWLVYLVTFSSDPAQNGLWLVDTQTLQRRRIEPFGAYRWRDNQRLLIAPLDLTNPLNSLWQVEVGGGAPVPLVGPAQAAFKIASGDWSVSPDGRYAVYLSAQDQNLWLLTLPED